MAIYHLEAKVITRSVGRTVCGAAAYMSCSRIYNDYDGIQHDYTRKGGLVWEHIFLPPAAPVEWLDRETLWNAVEATEKAKDSQLAREFIVALPVELNRQKQIDLVSDYIREQFTADGMCADAAIHDTGGGNPHAHILLTMRPLNEDGTWQKKTEKEYLCARDGEERGFTAAEFRAAEKEGWEKQYQYKSGGNKIYLPPSKAKGMERISKHPKSTKYGRQNPTTARWNSEDQLVKWREAWAEINNRYLEKAGRKERIDHRSFAEREIDEQPTIHEGVASRAQERAGMIADRCELNRQIKADNALLRSLKSTVKKLTEAVAETVASISDAMETVRENLLVIRFGLLHIRKRRKKAGDYLSKAKPLYRNYTELSAQIREKRSERSRLQKELSALPVLNVLKRREMKARLQTVSEDLSELENEAMTIVHGFGKNTPGELTTVRADISATEKAVSSYDAQEKKLTAAADRAKEEFDGLMKRAARLNTDELTAERLAVRPAHEDSAKRRIKAALNGGKPGIWDFSNAADDTDRMLGEISLAADFEELQRHKKRSERRAERKPARDDLER